MSFRLWWYKSAYRLTISSNTVKATSASRNAGSDSVPGCVNVELLFQVEESIETMRRLLHISDVFANFTGLTKVPRSIVHRYHVAATSINSGSSKALGKSAYYGCADVRAGPLRRVHSTKFIGNVCKPVNESQPISCS